MGRVEGLGAADSYVASAKRSDHGAEGSTAPVETTCGIEFSNEDIAGRHRRDPGSGPDGRHLDGGPEEGTGRRGSQRRKTGEALAPRQTPAGHAGDRAEEHQAECG